MIVHVLNGDALVEKFPGDIQGIRIIIREAFMDGPVSLNYDQGYWEERANYIAATYHSSTTQYADSFLSQLDLLKQAEKNDKIYFWFEDDLFCQINMWFAIHYLLQFAEPTMYRVFPPLDPDLWRGFGLSDEDDLQIRFQESIVFSKKDITLVSQLYEAYVQDDRNGMIRLSATPTTAFRYLSEVIQAHLDRQSANGLLGRPHKILREIVNEGNHTFREIFAVFSRREGVYGYGDVQVKNMLEEMGVEY